MTGRIWEWDGIQGNKDFATHVEEIHEFVRRNEHLPKLKSENREEHRYDSWLAHLRQRNKTKPLSKDERQLASEES